MLFLVVVKSAPVFWVTRHFWEGVAAFGTFFIAFLKWAWPPIRKRWARWRNWTLVRDGRAAVPNVSPAILAIPERLRNLDDGQLKIINDIAGYKHDHGAEMKAISTKIDEVITINEELIATVSRLFPNGEDTNEPGDLLSRTAKAVGAFLPNPKPVAHNRRDGDQKPDSPAPPS